MLYNGLPVYALFIDSDLEGIDFVSLVDMPAIQRDFIAFAKETEVKFSIDEEKRIVSGPVLIPDQKIYRKTEKGDFYVTFDRKAIEAVAQKFFADGNANNVNLMHDKEVNGCVYFESYFIDHARNIAPVEFSDLPDGTWIMSAKINNPDVWALIKNGTLRGFSVEGTLGVGELRNDEISTLEDLINRLK